MESVNIHELAYQDHGPIPAPFRAIFGPSWNYEPRWAGIENIRNIKRPIFFNSEEIRQNLSQPPFDSKQATSNLVQVSKLFLHR